MQAVLSRRSVSCAVTRLVRPVAPWIPIDLLARVPVVGEVDVPVPGTGRHVTMWTDGLDGVASILFWRGLEGWEPETVAVLLPLARRSSIVLDVGANVGFHTMLMAAANPAAAVHAFEPVERVCGRLRRNVELNALTNVTVHELALSDEGGIGSMRVPSYPVPVEASADPSFRGGGELVSVSFSTIDAFVSAQGLVSVDLVKLDTEGTEHLVLQGAVDTMQRHNPFVVAEVLPDQPPEGALGLVMGELGYVAFHLTDLGPVRRDEIAGELRFKNWLLAPAHRIDEVPRAIGSVLAKSVVWRHAMDATRRPSDPAVPEADALEQTRAWADEDDPDELRVPPDVPDNDALDQARPVPLEDEDR